MKLSYKFSVAPPPPAVLPERAQEAFEPPTDYWSIPPFGVLAFPGFQCTRTESPATFVHQAGHLAAITVRVLNGQPTAPQLEEVRSHARAQLTQIQESIVRDYGPANVVCDLHQLEGVELTAIRANRRDFSGSKYFLLFGALSHRGHLALVTVEGPGVADAMASSLTPIVKACHFAA